MLVFLTISFSSFISDSNQEKFHSYFGSKTRFEIDFSFSSSLKTNFKTLQMDTARIKLYLHVILIELIIIPLFIRLCFIKKY